MRAGEFIYCKRSEKKILIVSPSSKPKADMEAIFSQFDMPSQILQISDGQVTSHMLLEQKAHAILIDTASPHWQPIIHTVHTHSEKTPIIILHGDEKSAHDFRPFKDFVKKFIQRESLRFCGQILYRIINESALNRHYQLEMKTHRKIKENISGLKNIQDFWNDSANIQDEQTKNVLQELEQTLDYLEKLESELNLKPVSD